jgi:hypothetical protein
MDNTISYSSTEARHLAHGILSITSVKGRLGNRRAATNNLIISGTLLLLYDIHT